MTITGVCSLALMRVGSTATISNVDTDTSKEARMCRAVYPLAKDMILRSAPWNFATQEITLTVQTGASVTNWEYVYAYPASCLMVDSIQVEGSRNPLITVKPQFEVSSITGTGRVILSDTENAVAIARVKVDDVDDWDPLAQSALAWYIAMELAMSLSPANTNLSGQCRQGYVSTMHQAIAIMSNEQFRGIENDPEILTARL